MKVGAALNPKGAPLGSLWTGFGKGTPSHSARHCWGGSEWFVFVDTLTPGQSSSNLSRQHGPLEDGSKPRRTAVRELARPLTAQPALLLDHVRGGARLWLTLSNQMLNCSLSLSTCRMSHALLGLAWFRSCCLSSNAYWNAGAVAFAELFLILSPAWMTSSKELETCQEADI